MSNTENESIAANIMSRNNYNAATDSYSAQANIVHALNAKDVALRERERELEDIKKQKDGAYKERNLLLAALSKVQFAFLAKHPEEDTEWENDWRNIVVIIGIQQDFQLLQMTWHIHDSELHSFSHLKFDPKFVWDGHTTEEKYERLSRLTNTGVYAKP